MSVHSALCGAPCPSNETIRRSFMRTIVLATSTLALGLSATAADTYVNGYYKQDGTYVAPHHQTKPDANLYNNYSSQGQTNPYTGVQGQKRNEYSDPPAYQKSSPLYVPQQQQTTQSPYGYQQPKKSSSTDPYKW